MMLALRDLRDADWRSIANAERVLSDADDAPDRYHDKEADQAGYHDVLAALVRADVLDKPPKEDHKRKGNKHRYDAVEYVPGKSNEAS